jgi:hypothetical protein
VIPTAQRTKTSEATLAAQLVAGIGKHLANIATLMFASGQFTPAQVVAQLQTLVALRQGVNDARATLEARLAAEASQAPTLREFMLAFVAFVKSTFSKSPDVLADFGLEPKKAATPLTVEQKAAKVAKAEATRKARGTMGKKKKLAVHGDVTGVVVTPVSASAPVAATVSPAPSAAPAPAGNGAKGTATQGS